MRQLLLAFALLLLPTSSLAAQKKYDVELDKDLLVEIRRGGGLKPQRGTLQVTKTGKIRYMDWNGLGQPDLSGEGQLTDVELSKLHTMLASPTLTDVPVLGRVCCHPPLYTSVVRTPFGLKENTVIPDFTDHPVRITKLIMYLLPKRP